MKFSIFFIHLNRLLKVIVVVFLLFSCKKEEELIIDDPLLANLSALPGVEVTEIEPNYGFLRTFEIDVIQPVDHNNPDGQTFVQRIYLKHISDTLPMVINTSGYTVSERSGSELNGLFTSNHISVPQRYYDGARPFQLNWQYLTSKQIAGDCHRIVYIFKEIYVGEWISTGISKGGKNALCHRRFYPEDVDVTVAYVAPIILNLPDTRIDDFFETVGDEACRLRLIEFQRWLLENRDSMVSCIEDYAIEEGVSFSLGSELVFEYAVLEYPFSFWQWGPGECDAIPDETYTFREILDHMDDLIGISSLYSDEGIYYLEPSFYHAYTETGYYEHITENVEDLLTAATSYSNAIFAPQNVTLNYSSELMQDIALWLQTEGNNIIYIYGGNDPYTAAAVNITDATNAIKIIQDGADHRIKLSDLDDKELVYDALEQWLDVEIIE